ncbi:hypothetical protein BC829DRAFT_488742 [Chytridium lagenaria]|nr:hypothetical protein BC829DRAFT_488742 [Chytridium lagenaria]
MHSHNNKQHNKPSSQLLVIPRVSQLIPVNLQLLNPTLLTCNLTTTKSTLKLHHHQSIYSFLNPTLLTCNLIYAETPSSPVNLQLSQPHSPHMQHYNQIHAETPSPPQRTTPPPLHPVATPLGIDHPNARKVILVAVDVLRNMFGKRQRGGLTEVRSLQTMTPTVTTAPELEDELVALKAIFEEDFSFEHIGDGGVLGWLSVAVSLPDEIFLRVGGDLPPATSTTSPIPPTTETTLPPPIPTPATSPTPPTDTPAPPPVLLPVQHVPPVMIRFRLPPGYPLTCGPSISLECGWMSPRRLARLRKRLLGMWRKEEGEVVMYGMCDFVKEEMTGFLKLVEMAPVAKLFDQSLVTCGICFDDMKGALCLCFNACRHSYCRECLKDYFSLMIQEGEIKQVACPDESCKKKQARAAIDAAPLPGSAVVKAIPLITVDDSEVLAIVGEELFARYTELKMKQALEGRMDVTYCPRPLCQSPVIKETGDEKLCICPSCRFAFCFFCGRTWHGYAQFCKISKILEVAKEYRDASDAVKRTLEIRYGRKVLEKALRDLNDEALNAEWLKSNTQSCPSCCVSVQRSYGCSHITCRVCETHFCYLCGDTLKASNPYAHYNDKRSQCYNRLFEDNEGRIPDGNRIEEVNFEDEFGDEEELDWGH